MSDTFEKIRPYFQSMPRYWKLAPFIPRNFNGQIGFYPISFRDRLYQNHYKYFDSEGLPRFHSKAGKLVYFCTGLCSFALAHWEEFLLTRKIEHEQKVIKVANKLRTMAIEINQSLMIYDYDDDRQNNPVSCAMNQGEAISVMIRTYSLTSESKFLEWAIKLALPFLREYGKDGVSSRLHINQELWFLEGGRCILNGHIYALIGLMELQRLHSVQWLDDLIHQGTVAVQRSLPLFDSGYWSWYQISPQKYIASAMYHNLHNCQLQVLAELTGLPEFTFYINKFSKYSRNPLYRLWSGYMLILGKLRMKFGIF